MHAQNSLFSTIRNEITCDTCLESSLNEESTPLLQIPVHKTIQSSWLTVFDEMTKRRNDEIAKLRNSKMLHGN